MNITGYEIRPYADLRNAKLSKADLRGANLSKADLRWADLSRADLRGANLRWADLSADLRGTDLRWADLSRADLRGANLSRADLRGANLSRADLSRADMIEANLRGADLSEAQLRGARLSEAELIGVKTYKTQWPHGWQLPQEGSLVVWKSVNGVLVKLIIPDGAGRTGTPISNKCRCAWAYVAWIEGEQTEITSDDRKFTYRRGRLAIPDDWDYDMLTDCSNGIHFYRTREEAIASGF